MNRLAHSTSPYLRQHASNPVDWYPWGPEALELAAREDKPLFVSIGYASCHWCHVMAHESFEDPATAADLKRWFVAVKVDREERPDLDAVYMAAVQAQTGSGGWPMSVFCTPDGRPFLAGTYFPPEDRHGLPGFRHLLEAVARAWAERRADVESQADALHRAVAEEASVVDRLTPAPGAPAIPPFAGGLDRAVADLATRFDRRWGGFGPAPKFPRPSLVELCLLHHRATGREASLTMATTTLDAMAAGGIYDHLAGGFARYATDTRWMVPHFEKMLTDQALLARAYLHAWQHTGHAPYLQVVTETLDYVLDGLAAPGGGLCSSVDADAGGVEGGHATFTVAEVRQALAGAGRPDLTDVALEWYQVVDPGPWEGTNVPHRPPGAPLARPAPVEEARRLLLEARLRRPHPARDDKILVEWNAMAAATLAQAAAATGNRRWGEAARDVATFLLEHLRDPGGRWRRSLGAAQPAFAADQAWVVECFVRLGELDGGGEWVERAAREAHALLAAFDDPDRGGLFTTAGHAERLVVRGKEWLDGATPSANAVAAAALCKVGALTGEEGFEQAGRRILEAAAPLLAEHPAAVPDLLLASAWADGGTEVVVAGERPDLLDQVRRRWLPTTVVAWGEPWPSPLWEGRDPGAAYVCHRYACRAPATRPDTLASQLEETAAGGATVGGPGRTGP